jgi:hypothetical protein
VRLDHLAQFLPRHDAIHGGEELIAPCRATVALEALGLIGGHGKGLLLHGATTFNVGESLTLISIALSVMHMRTHTAAAGTSEIGFTERRLRRIGCAKSSVLARRGSIPL